MKKIMVFGVFVLIFLLVVLVGCGKKETATEVKTASTGPTGKAIQPIEKSCEDSDGGINVEKGGKVSGAINGEEYTIYDKCVAGLLVEYYCDGDSYKNENVRCKVGKCLGGACRDI
ncbi:hypothetical protein J4209_00830 [Candidatus Woesearchaeota archaeon]|nr:hypothetical protein [Candidatus Woesearchaeota archaeon]